MTEMISIIQNGKELFMNEELIRSWLIIKFEEIARRITLVLEQLNDEQVNWRPNDASNSISNLIIHITANINERINKGINNIPYERKRESEFESCHLTKNELIDIIKMSFHDLVNTTKKISFAKLGETQLVRGRERTNLEILLQCATHFSEHMGQILFIGKSCLDENYKTTSIPRQ